MYFCDRIKSLWHCWILQPSGIGSWSFGESLVRFFKNIMIVQYGVLG